MPFSASGGVRVEFGDGHGAAGAKSHSPSGCVPHPEGADAGVAIVVSLFLEAVLIRHGY